MEAIKSKIYVSWDDIEHLVHDLCTQITMSNLQIDHIFGLPRGGLVPAVMISHRLGIPMTQDPNLSNVLIVDDICDSGETFIKWSKTSPNAEFACLHFKPKTASFKPTFPASSFHSDEWIVYPWERADSNAIQDYLKF